MQCNSAHYDKAQYRQYSTVQYNTSRSSYYVNESGGVGKERRKGEKRRGKERRGEERRGEERRGEERRGEERRGEEM